MAKAEKGSIKDIGKRIKAKGLQKLKFYCQMCEKQCRDANGFKCHQTSESHLRQMKIFSENAKGMMDRFSKEFEKEYLQTLKQRHTTKRVNANNVYQEVIADKQHIHMNATRWASLSDFVMYLGKKGLAKVDETERGWYVQFIENDASILARKEAQERRAAAEKQAEAAQAIQMENQRREAAKMLDRAGGTIHREATKLDERDGDEKVVVSLTVVGNNSSSSGGAGGASKKKNKKKATGFFDDGEDDDDDDDEEDGQQQQQIIKAVSLPPSQPTNTANNTNSTTNGNNKRLAPSESVTVKSVTETISSKSQQKSSKRPKHDDDYDHDNDAENDLEEEIPWLKRDILVRIINKKLAEGKYFRQKAIVDHVLKEDKFRCEVEVLDGGDVLRLDQADLETVVPKVTGKKVRVLKGKYRGKKAKVLELDKKKYRATLQLIDTEHENGGAIILEKVDYEEFSQLA